MKITKRQLKQIIREEKSKILKEMAQFNDAHSALKTPLGHGSNMSDVSGDLWATLMDIFQEAFAKGMSKERIAGIAQDAAREFDV